MKGMSSEIITIFEEMKSRGIELKEATYLAVIRALTSLGKPEVSTEENSTCASGTYLFD